MDFRAIRMRSVSQEKGEASPSKGPKAFGGSPLHIFAHISVEGLKTQARFFGEEVAEEKPCASQ